MDNLDNKLQNNLEDKAWASMKVLLDKEMPELLAPTLSDVDSKEKKKRRFLFFFLFFFGLIGTGLGYYIHVQNKDLDISKNELTNNMDSVNKTVKNNRLNDVISQKKEENTEGVTLKNNSLIQSNKSIIKLKENNLIKSKNETNLTIKNNSQNIDNQLVTIKNDIDFDNKNSTQNKSVIELNKPNNAIEKDINSNIKSDKNSANLTQNKTEINKENNVAIEAKKEAKEEPYIASIKSISTTDFMGILQPQPIYFDNKNELKIDYKLLKKLSKIDAKKWSYGLVLGLNTEGSPKMLTGFGGVFLQRDLSAKWSVNTGLNYRVLAKNVTNVEYLQSADSLVGKSSSVSVPTSTTNNLLRVNKAYLRNLYYLEIPIQINYHLSRKVSFFSGVKIAYLVSQNVSTNSNDQPIFLTSQYAALDVNRIIAESKYSSSDLGLNKWDVGLLGGVNLNFSKRFSTQLRYDLGLMDIYDGKNVAVYNSFIGLSGTYRF